MSPRISDSIVTDARTRHNCFNMEGASWLAGVFFVMNKASSVSCSGSWPSKEMLCIPGGQRDT